MYRERNSYGFFPENLHAVSKLLEMRMRDEFGWLFEITILISTGSSADSDYGMHSKGKSIKPLL